jgi:hypothetical protein
MRLRRVRFVQRIFHDKGEDYEVQILIYGTEQEIKNIIHKITQLEEFK